MKENSKAPGIEYRRRKRYLWRRRQIGRGDRWRHAHTLNKTPVLETVVPLQGVRELGACSQAVEVNLEHWIERVLRG